MELLALVLVCIECIQMNKIYEAIRTFQVLIITEEIVQIVESNFHIKCNDM